MRAEAISGVALGEIAGEAVLLAGAGAAILLQIADPAVAAGVARHSDFANRPTSRLSGTLDFIYGTVYGNDAVRALVRRHVNRAHAPVRGYYNASIPADGTPKNVQQQVSLAARQVSPSEQHLLATKQQFSGSEQQFPHSGERDEVPYNAYDPELQRWVAATLLYETTTVYETIYGPLGCRSRERLVREFAPLATSLQTPIALWPDSPTAFTAFWEGSLARLRVTDEARATAQALLHPTTAPAWMRALMPIARLSTAGFLPTVVREQYGLPWSPREQNRFARLIRTTARIYPPLPSLLRHAPAAARLRILNRKAAAHRSN